MALWGTREPIRKLSRHYIAAVSGTQDVTSSVIRLKPDLSSTSRSTYGRVYEPHCRPRLDPVLDARFPSQSLVFDPRLWPAEELPIEDLTPGRTATHRSLSYATE